MATSDLVALLAVVLMMTVCDAAIPLWNLKFLNGTPVYPNARCLDGSSYGYFVQYSPINSSRWLFYLEGGNYCNSQSACQNRVQGNFTGGGSSSRLRSGMFDGLNMVDSDPEMNPDFYADNHVYMPYCSADLWTGRRTEATEETWGYYFSGRHIIDAMLSVIQDYGTSIGRPVTEVILAGGSAGANGVMYNADFVRERLPASVRVVGFPNAGWASNETRSYGQFVLGQSSNGSAEIRKAAAVWDALIDPACREYYAEDWHLCFGYNGYRFLRAEMFIAQSTFELGAPVWTAPYDDNTVGYLEEYGAILNRQLEIVRNGTLPRNGLFQPSCVTHTIHWYQILVNGTTLQQAFGDWYFNRTGRKVWAEPFTPLPCNPSPLCGWSYCGAQSTTGVQTDYAAGPPCAFDASGSTGRFVNASLAALTAKLTDLTLSAWIWLNASHSGSADHYIVMVGSAPSNGYGILVNANVNNNVAMKYWGVTQQTLQGYSVPLKQWVFLSAVSRTLNSWDFYANGNYLGAVSFYASLNPPTAGLSIGGAITASNRNFDGRIGAVQFWSTARSSYQLLYDATDELSGTEPNLLLAVPFCSGGTSTLGTAGPGGSSVVFTVNGTVLWYKQPGWGATTEGSAPTTGIMTTSAGTRSTGAPSLGTTHPGLTPPPGSDPVLTPPTPTQRTRYTSYIMQSSSVAGWRLNFTGSAGPGQPVPVGAVVRDVSLKGRDMSTVHVTLAPSQTSATLYVVGWSNPLPAGALVVGIRVQITRRASAVGLRDAQLALVVDGTLRPAGGQCPGLAECSWPTDNSPMTSVVFGGPTSTWGLSPEQLTAAAVNVMPSGTQLGFGYALTVTNVGSVSIEGFFEQSEVTMWYTTAATPGTTLVAHTTSTGTTSTGTTSTGTTSTGTTSTGTTSTGTTSTGTTFTGTTLAGTTGPASAGTTGIAYVYASVVRPCTWLGKSSTSYSWSRQYIDRAVPYFPVAQPPAADSSLVEVDGRYALNNLAKGVTGAVLYALGFTSPLLPSGSIVTGIEVAVVRTAGSGSNVPVTAQMSLMVGGSLRTATNRCPRNCSDWTPGVHEVRYGGATELWGLPQDVVTAAALSASPTDLGVGFQASNPRGVSLSVMLDAISMIVHYRAPIAGSANLKQEEAPVFASVNDDVGSAGISAGIAAACGGVVVVAALVAFLAYRRKRKHRFARVAPAELVFPSSRFATPVVD